MLSQHSTKQNAKRAAIQRGLTFEELVFCLGFGDERQYDGRGRRHRHVVAVHTQVARVTETEN